MHPDNPRVFPKWKARYNLRSPMSKHDLTKYSPKWGYSRIMNFPYRGSHFRPRMNTLVVSIDGGSRGNDKNNPTSRAAYGVFFGNGCAWNRYKCLDQDDQQTSGRAELRALEQALILLGKRYSGGELETVTEIIIKTDSEYVMKSMTEYIWKWEKNGYQKSGGGVIEHVELIKGIQSKIQRFEDVYGIDIKFWRVGREYNTEADALCNKALDEWEERSDSDSGYTD